MQNRDIIEAADVILIDYYVNDVNYYHLHAGPSFSQRREDFFDLLSSLNVPVVNIMFPFMNLHRNPAVAAYHESLKLSAERNIACVDLNILDLSPDCFMDPQHVDRNISYFFGVMLERIFENLADIRRPSGGSVVHNPYRIIEAEKFNCAAPLAKLVNSVVNVSYLPLREALDIPLRSDEEVISIGYVNPEKDCPRSLLDICGTVFALNEYGYFHEALDSPISGSISLNCAGGKKSAP